MSARILLVTAESTLTSGVATALGREGYELKTTDQGVGVLGAWESDAPDVLLVDARLPDMTGAEVVRRVREIEGDKAHTPIVLIGPADMISKIEGLRAGADDYVVQPVHPTELTARVRALLVRFGTAERAQSSRTALGQLHAYYGAKGGVGTTTLAINTAIALHQLTKRSVALVDGNLQFGDHRVFLDLGPDRRSIVDACSATGIDADLVRKVVVRHETGIDLMLAPATPEEAELVSPEQHQLLEVVEVLRSIYDYVVVDLDQRLDDHALDVIGAADQLMVVMTADLSCIKNVRLLLETMAQIGVPDERMALVLNRNKAFTGISIKSAESVLRRTIAHQVVNDYRTAISALNNGRPFMDDHADSPIGRAIVQLARAVSVEAPEPSAKAPRIRRLAPATG
ncbi:response regulator [soil metagenome]